MRKGASGPAQDDPAIADHHPAPSRHKSAVAPAFTRGRHDADSGRGASPNRTPAGFGRTLPAITPSAGLAPGHGQAMPVPNGSTQDFPTFSHYDASRPGGVHSRYPNIDRHARPGPNQQGLLGRSPALSVSKPPRVTDAGPHRSMPEPGIDPRQSIGPSQHPPLSISERRRSLSSRTSPSSTASAYASPSAHHPPYGSHLPASASEQPSMRPVPGPSPATPSSQLPRASVAAGGVQPTGATQYMTVETSHGQMHIPMDVQGASRMADEKRRRNAGASARFRQRRKEKEMASSREIDDLKRQIRDLSDDCDFYRSERDVFMAAAYKTPEGSRLFPRPSSPHRQRSLVDPSSPSEGTQDSPRVQHFEERGEHDGGGSHTRRRLDTPPPQYAPYRGHAPDNAVQQPLAQQPATLPPLQPQSNQSATQLPQIRSVSYPGFATPQHAGSVSPWQFTPNSHASHSQSHSQTHSRSQSSSRSYQSGA